MLASKQDHTEAIQPLARIPPHRRATLRDFSDFFRPLEVLAHDPDRPTGIICIGARGMLRPPFRAAIGDAEAMVLDVAQLTDPDRVVLVTNVPSGRLPSVGRVSIFALHLGSFCEVVAELPGQRVKGLQLHAYKSHRKSGRLVDIIAGDGFLLHANGADVPIIDEPVMELTGFSSEGLAGALRDVAWLPEETAKVLVGRVRRAMQGVR